jgi:hypothetical protein
MADQASGTIRARFTTNNSSSAPAARNWTMRKPDNVKSGPFLPLQQLGPAAGHED